MCLLVLVLSMEVVNVNKSSILTKVVKKYVETVDYTDYLAMMATNYGNKLWQQIRW